MAPLKSKARSKDKRRESSSWRFPTHGVVTFLLGFATGPLVMNVWTSKDFFAELTKQIASSPQMVASSAGHTVQHYHSHTVEKMNRFWKYYQTYQYIPPASRYDYVPVPDKSCGVGPDFAPWWELNYNDRSRMSEDKFIYETFFKNLNATHAGTYVELGAYNGRQESNTRFFDICLGWKGLLVEGNPENYQKAIGNRQYAHRMSYAPSCSAEYEATNKTIQFYRYPMTNAGLPGKAITYAGKPTVDVPCGPFSPVLEDIFAGDVRSNSDNLPTLDFFSLDVEGAEVMVLSTVDFQAIRIHILMIEIKNNHCQSDDCEVRRNVRAKMAAEGYQRYEGLVPASDIYVHPKSPFQIPKSIAVPK